MGCLKLYCCFNVFFCSWDIEKVHDTTSTRCNSFSRHFTILIGEFFLACHQEIKLPKYFLSCSLVHLSEILRPLGAMQMQSQSLGDKYWTHRNYQEEKSYNKSNSIFLFCLKVFDFLLYIRPSKFMNIIVTSGCRNIFNFLFDWHPNLKRQNMREKTNLF